MAMDVVDYEIKGAEMQFVEVELDPGEAAVGEAGSMMFMDAGIQMDAVFGDGSAQQSGLFGKLLGAGKRLLTGESLFTTVFTNQGQGKQHCARRRTDTGDIRKCKSCAETEREQLWPHHGATNGRRSASRAGPMPDTASSSSTEPKPPCCVR